MACLKQGNSMNKKTKMWIWILGGIAGLVILAFVVGSFLPENYRARGYLDVAMSPEELWTKLQDFEHHPVSATMCKATERLPNENGMPVWIEDMGSTKFRVQTTSMEKPKRLVRELSDQVVPMTATVVIEIEPRDGGCRVHMSNHVVIKSGTWHVPVFRLMMSVAGGVKGGIRGYLAQVVGKQNAAVHWQ